MKFPSRKPVRVWKTPVNGFDSWTVSYWEGNKRIRKRFPTKGAANKEASRISTSLAAGERNVIDSSSLATAKRVEQLCASIGVAPEVMASEYVKLRQAIPDASIEAITECWREHRAGIVDKPVSDVVTELLEYVRQAGNSDVWRRSLDTRLNGLGDALKKPFSAISADDIAGWFNRNDWTGVTQNNRRTAIAQLEKFAIERKYRPKDSNLLALVPRPNTQGKDIQVFTPNELKTLLKAAPSKIRHYLAIAAFSGIRQAEILRLRWENFSGGWIRIDAGKTKTKMRRIVPVLPALEAQIEDRPASGPVWDVKPDSAASSIIDLAKEAGIKWKRNALRHSFVSYRLAATQNASQVAMESGNSERMIHRHYKELVTQIQAEEWFAIR